ncbi:MAG: hypothetical protein J2P21_27170 [Chloracidobacterium sp.]|nr:hypothetical protein [Chloracidobacterium sp.]
MAARREAAIRRLIWSARSHAFTDYAWRRRETLPVTAAGLFPLLFQVANQRQAKMEAQTMRRKPLIPKPTSSPRSTRATPRHQPGRTIRAESLHGMKANRARRPLPRFEY